MRRFERVVIKVTSYLNLRRKILLLYGLIVLIPTIVFSMFAIHYSMKAVRDNYMVTINEAVKQTSQNIEFRKQSYDLLAVRTATDGELIARLSREHQDMFDQLATVEYVDRSFAMIGKQLRGVKSFRIYHTNPTLVQDGNLLWKPENRIFAGMSEEIWYNASLKEEKSPSWMNVPHSNDQLVVSHKIISSNGQGIGAIFMELDYEEVFGDLLGDPFNGLGELYVLDKSNTIIASSIREEIGTVSEQFSAMFAVAETGDSHAAVGSVTEGKQYFMKNIEAGWTIVGVLHVSELERQSTWIMYLILLAIVFFLFLSTSLVLIVMKNIVLRIQKLGNRMNDIAQGQFSVSVRNRGNDELGELESLFNSMSGKLSVLVEDITQAKLKEREQSFRALQAQINPHFIYNSLSLIRWRAMDLDDQEQIKTIDALTTFYRLALDNAINVTRIEQELQHVQAYLEIQQLRYQGLVNVVWEIDESLLSYYTIKLLLQPIVENSYIHGAITSKAAPTLKISIQKEEQRICMSIYDEGIGIAPDTLRKIRQGERAGSGNGYGLANIRERLFLYFGEEGEFAIESEQGHWTLIEIKIPMFVQPPELRKESQR